MKHGLYALVLLGIAMGLTACNDDNPWASVAGTGGIRLHVTTDNQVTDARPTRAGDLTAPAAEDFSIRLDKTDGSISKTWASLADFNQEDAFSTGAYNLTAFYGNIEDEGFELPCFQGSTQLMVLEQRLTEVEVTATLANTMVSIDYTDAFKKYFSDYKTTVHSEGHSYVEIPKDETRPAFIAPGNVDLTVEFTKPNGQNAKIQPASFAGLAKHHYHITFDVNNGNVGEAQLTIEFDDTLAQEEVTIDLTEELFTSEAPKINPSGFTSGETLELLSYTAPENPLKFTLIAHGGLSEAILTIASSSWTPSFGKEINLISANPTQQQQIADTGIKVIGLYKNPDNFASVDISGLISKLPAGEYEISMMAKDKFTRVSDPVSIRITSVPLELQATPNVAIFGLGSATVDVSYNGTNPKEDITFQAMNRNGVFVNAPVTECIEATRTRSIPVKNYIMTISLPDSERQEIPVKVFLKGNELAQFSINVEIPEYEIAADAFSTFAVLKVNTEADQLKSITNALRIVANGTAVDAGNIQRNLDQGVIYVKGLTKGTVYQIQTALTSDMSGSKTIEVTTENATPVSNGDFSDTKQTINMSLQTGGPYTGTALSRPVYSLNSSIDRSEAIGWASLNTKTCWTGSSNLNTWFCAPSTWVENGVANIQSVGYNHNGTTPDLTKKTATYYCQNAPSFGDSNRASGEMFLGSYNFDGTEHRTDGISFDSRPKSISFDYSYVPNGNETGLVYVAITGTDGTVIAGVTEKLEASSSMTLKVLSLGNYAFGKKASGIQIKFLSTSAGIPSLNIPSGSELSEGITMSNFTNPPAISANNYKAKASGSLLKIDNVKLNY